MPWRDTQKMDLKVAFIADWKRLVASDPQQVSMAELCRNYGISRQSGYELVERYRGEGADAFKDRSRAPHSHPHAVGASTEQMIVDLRAEHPTWGPKKLKGVLERKWPRRHWPAQSTIGEILDRHGLVKRRRHKRHAVPSCAGLSPADNPNDVWGVDFKGWFRTGDGKRCDPFSLTDLATRYGLRLQAVQRMDTEHVWPLFDAAFREFGLPLKVRSDNGAPFASTGLGGLSRLAVRLIKAGTLPERIEPGKPQQNGRHERFHLTVKGDTADPPAATIRAQQRRFDAFLRGYNEERPHEALGLTTPADHYRPSQRRYRGRLCEPEYEATCEVRRVRTTGEIKWRGQLIYLTEALIGEPVAIEQTEDGLWLLSYGPVDLGWLDDNANLARAQGGDASPPCATASTSGGKCVTHVPG
jgi:transposase InsO family protein